MVALKTIQDALMARIRSQVPALNAKTVKPWRGSIEAFFSEGTTRPNLPFCGVYFGGSAVGESTVDNSVAPEEYTWRLTIIAENNRGMEFSQPEALELIDDIRAALIGHRLTGYSPPVAPLRIGAVTPVEEETERCVTAYEMEIYTWQVQQS